MIFAPGDWEGGWTAFLLQRTNKETAEEFISRSFFISFFIVYIFIFFISRCFLYFHIWVFFIFYIFISWCFFYISIFYVSILFLPQLTKLFFHVKNWSTLFACHLDNVNSKKTAIPCGGDRTVEQFKLLNRLQNSAFFKKYFW